MSLSYSSILLKGGMSSSTSGSNLPSRSGPVGDIQIVFMSSTFLWNNDFFPSGKVILMAFVVTMQCLKIKGSWYGNGVLHSSSPTYRSTCPIFSMRRPLKVSCFTQFRLPLKHSYDIIVQRILIDLFIKYGVIVIIPNQSDQ